MDNDSYNPFKIRASQVVGIKTLIANAIKATSISLPVETLKIPKGTITWFLLEVEKAFITVTEALNEKNVVMEFGAIAKEVNALLAVRARNKGLGPGQEAARAAIRAIIGEDQIDFMGEGGTSAFLQLAGHVNQESQVLEKRSVKFGSNSVLVPNGNQLSNNTIINHGLGVTPVLVLAICRAAPSSAFVLAMNVFGESPTQFIVNGLRPGVTGESNVSFFWLAIG